MHILNSNNYSKIIVNQTNIQNNTLIDNNIDQIFNNIPNENMNDHYISILFALSALVIISFLAGRRGYLFIKSLLYGISNFSNITSAKSTPTNKNRNKEIFNDESETTKLNSINENEINDNLINKSDLIIPPIFRSGVLSTLLNISNISYLLSNLPTRFLLKDWKLLYNTVTDGTSLNQFYRKLSNKGPTVTVLQDKNGYIFGVFIAESWHKSTSHFGNGETFVFKLEPEVKIFRWFEDNDYFAYAKADFIAIGGGSNYAIRLDNDLNKGVSGYCETFHSPCLASYNNFELQKLEVWGFD